MPSFPYLNFLKLFTLDTYPFYHTHMLIIKFTKLSVVKITCLKRCNGSVNVFSHLFMNSFHILLKGTCLMPKTKLHFSLRTKITPYHLIL